MKKIICRLVLILMIIVCATNSLLAQDSDLLDGKSYQINLTQLSGNTRNAWKKDILIFETGKMYSKRMQKQEGFGVALYYPIRITSDQGEEIKFSYQHVNKYGSSLKIEGVSSGNSIEGKILWESDMGVNTYTFVGILILK